MADPTEMYGENWLLCVTRKAYEAQMEMLQQRERDAQEALAAQEKENSPPEDDLSKIVYEDRPMVARAWVSTTTRDTHDDVEALSIRSTRQLVRVAFDAIEVVWCGVAKRNCCESSSDQDLGDQDVGRTESRVQVQ